MAELLSEVEYGRVLGSFTAVEEDSGGTVAPDAIPLSGSIQFIPSRSHVSYVNSSGETASLYVSPVTASISNGRIIASDGQDGVVLLASDSNNVSASVLWTANININPINSGDEAPENHKFLIEVRRNEIVSLIDVIKANSRVHNIALFNDAIAEAAAEFWRRVDSGEFRGNQGPPGPAGVGGVGVPGPIGIPGYKGKDGDPGVGGNLIPDGDLEEPGFLVSGDYQNTTDSVNGTNAVRLTNATSRKILLTPERSYIGGVYAKADENVNVTIALRVFGPEGDISRVIETVHTTGVAIWRDFTFALDSIVGDQSVEIVVTTDGRVAIFDFFTLTDSTVIQGLQTQLSEAKAALDSAMSDLAVDLAHVDSERERLNDSLNDLAAVLEDADVDLTVVNEELADLRDDLATEESNRQQADEAAQLIMNQLDLNLAQAKDELAANKVILDNLDAELITSKEELDQVAQNISDLETVTIPNLKDILEAADAAAAQNLTDLDNKLYGATGDITTAKESITQLDADLAAEALAREQMALEIAEDFTERDSRLTEAENVLDIAFPEGAFNVPQELARTVRDSVVQYAVSGSESVPPTTGWSIATPTRTPGEYIWFRTVITYADDSTSTSSAAVLTGNAGEPGEPGPPGEPGADGTGVTILGSVPTEADLPSSGSSGDAYLVGGYLYVWTSGSWSNVGLIRGPQGVPGPAGEDGAPRYTWVKYGTSSTGDGISDDPAGKTYIGLAYNKTTAIESGTPSDYQWALIQGPQGSPGIPGQPGADGQSLYTWLKYASTPTSGMSDSPTGKDYMGLAYNKTTPTESTNYSDYTWTLVKGTKGDQGVPGAPGADGSPRYTWVKYATSSAGAGMSDDPTGKTYIGLAYNKTTDAESAIASDYQWALIQGPKGDPGNKGDTGAQGVGISAITPYFRDAAKGSSAPAKPTTSTPTGWSLTEPTWVPNRELYRVEKITYTNGAFAYTDVTRVSSYAGIDAAMAAANGKNVNTYTDLAPESKPGPAPAPNPSRTVGDVHRNRDQTSGEIWAEYVWSGSAWVSVSYGDQILRSLDVGKITGGTGSFQQFFADKLIADDATINSLWADKIVGKTAAFNQISVAAGNILVDPNGLDPTLRNNMGGPAWSWDDTGKYWKRPSIQGGTTQFNAYTNTGSVYDSNLLDPGAMYVIRYDVWVDSVGPNTQTRASIYYRRKDGTTAFVGDAVEPGGDTDQYSPITAGEWNSVTRYWRAPDDVQSGGINFQVVLSGPNSSETRIRNPFVGKQAPAVLIEDGAISAQKINAESVAGAVGRFIELETSRLIATDGITTPSAVIEKLWADGINAKSITAAKLSVGPNNIFPDPYFQSPDSWNISDGRVQVYPDSTPQLSYVRITTRDIQTGAYFGSSNDRPVTVTPGTTYRVRFQARADSDSQSTVRAGVAFRYTREDGGSATSTHYSEVSTGGEWGNYEGTVTVLDDAIGIANIGVFDNSPFAVGDTLDIRSVLVTPMVGTVLIEDGAVNASKINAESVAAAVGQFVTVEAGNIVAGTANIDSLVAQKIAAATAAFQTVNADKIIASSATMDSATINQIWADGIAAKAITANKLVVATGNIVPDGDEMATEEQWAPLTRDLTDKPASTIAARKTAPGQRSVSSLANTVFPVIPGQVYSVQMWVKADKPNSKMYVEVRDAVTGGHAGTGTLEEPVVANTASYFLLNNRVVPTEWTLFRGTWTVNPGVSSARFGSFYFNHTAGVETGASISIAGISIKPKVGAVLIENGAVSANHISSNSIDTNHLRANAITADKIGANQIVAGKIAAQAVDTAQLRANAIDADKIAANAVVAGKIAADSVSAREIKANTITAAQINAGTITAQELAAGSVTAVKITAGAVTTEKMTANSINGDRILANTITGDKLVVNTATIDRLWTNGLNAKTITTSRISVGRANLIPNGDGSFGDLTYWPYWAFSEGAPAATGAVNGFRSASTNFLPIAADEYIPVEYSNHYLLDVYIEPSVAGMDTAIQVQYLSATGASISSEYPVWPKNMAAGLLYFSGTFSPPLGATQVKIRIVPAHANGAAGNVTLYNLRLRPKTWGTLIEDGAITTEHIKVGTLNGNRIQANTITAEKITGGSFEGKTFNGGVFVGGIIRTATSAPYAYMGNITYSGSSEVAAHGFVVAGTNGSVIRIRSGQSTGGAGVISLSDSDDSRSIEIRGSKNNNTGHGIKVFHKNGQDAINLYKTGENNARSAVMLHRDDGTRSVELWSADVETHAYLGVNDGAGKPTQWLWGNGPLSLANARIVYNGVHGDGVWRDTLFLGDSGSNAWISVHTGASTRIGDVRIKGNVYFENIITTSGTPNVYMNSSSGLLARSTSSRRYKKNIEDWSPSVDSVLAMRPRQWQHIDQLSFTDNTQYVGFVAEEIDDLGLKGLVSYSQDENGNWRPESLNYDRFAAAQQLVLQDHDSRVNELESMVEELKAELDDLRSRI